MINVYMLPAGQGDFFIIEFGKKEMHYILVDGGDKAGAIVYKQVLTFFGKNNKKIDAIILTHIDDDHIYGALTTFNTISGLPVIDRIYINTGENVERCLDIQMKGCKPECIEREYLHVKHKCHSVAKALSLKELFINQNMEAILQSCVKMGDILEIEGASLKIISPGETELVKYLKYWEKELEKKEKKNTHAGKIGEKRNLTDYMEEESDEDTSVTNGSSIAFIFEYEEYKLAFLGDAHPSVCVQGIKLFYESDVKADLIKVPHHGSCHNYSEELYNLLNCKTFLLSTNGKNNKPHPVFLAKIFAQCSDARVYCNSSWFKNYGFTKIDEYKYLSSENPKIILLGDRISLRKGLYLCGNVKKLGIHNS